MDSDNSTFVELLVYLAYEKQIIKLGYIFDNGSVPRKFLALDFDNDKFDQKEIPWIPNTNELTLSDVVLLTWPPDFPYAYPKYFSNLLLNGLDGITPSERDLRKNPGGEKDYQLGLNIRNKLLKKIKSL